MPEKPIRLELPSWKISVFVPSDYRQDLTAYYRTGGEIAVGFEQDVARPLPVPEQSPDFAGSQLVRGRPR